MNTKKGLIIFFNVSMIIFFIYFISQSKSSETYSATSNDFVVAQHTSHKKILNKYNGDMNALMAEIDRLIQKNTLCSLVEAENLSGRASTDSESEIDQKLLKLNKLAGQKEQIRIFI